MNTIQLHKEDCLKTLKRLPDNSIDLFLQDTPFGVTQNEWDIKPNFETLWPEWKRAAKENTAFLFFGTQPFASELIMSNLKWFRYDLIWQKSHSTGFLNSKKMPLRSHESILVFYKHLPKYNPQLKNKPKVNIRPVTKRDRSTNNYGEFKSGNHRTISVDKEYPKSVWCFDVENKKNIIHETQKPLKLIRELIKTFSDEGDTVFDGYSGSGTTAAACIKENRNFIGSEMNTGKFDKSMKRISEMQAELTLF